MRLGEQIVHELGLERSNDTLSRWLAHHVAELINAAQDAQQTLTPEQAHQAAQQCRAAILQLWQHRTSWPHGWPPPGALQITRQLDGLPEPGPGGWHDNRLLSVLQDTHHRLLEALVDCAASGHAKTVEEQWLEHFGEILTEDETAILTRVVGTNQRLSRLMSLVREDKDTDDADSDTDTKHPVLVLADAYRDFVYNAVDRALRTAQAHPDEPETPATRE
ncbi:MAG: hypothetical protein ACRDRI_11240 [Pseudonocardiaceae bacterium]